MTWVAKVDSAVDSAADAIPAAELTLVAADATADVESDHADFCLVCSPDADAALAVACRPDAVLTLDAADAIAVVVVSRAEFGWQKFVRVRETYMLLRNSYVSLGFEYLLRLEFGSTM